MKLSEKAKLIGEELLVYPYATIDGQLYQVEPDEVVVGIEQLESTNAELTKRVAELDETLARERLLNAADAQRLAALRINALPSNCTNCNGHGAEPPGCPESGPCETCGGWTTHKRLVAGETTELRRRIAELEARDTSRDESKLHSRNVLEKRVAELEARLRFTAESLRSLSPGPHPGPMNAEDYVPLIAKRVAELESERKELRSDKAELVEEVADLQSQLAWTPVEKGLPTEPGWYVFGSDDAAPELLNLNPKHWHDTKGWNDNFQGINPDAPDWGYRWFRRIELPEAK